MEAKYATILAARTARLEKRGIPSKEASRRAKAFAERWLADHKK